MSRRIVRIGGALVLLVALGWLMAGTGGVPSSALSRGAAGWLAARHYLEASGRSVELLDRPLSEAEATSGLWVLAFPWQRRLERGEIDAFHRHLRAGGAALVGYSHGPFGEAEEAVLGLLDVRSETVRPDPPLLPWKWWRYQREEWTLHPAAGEGAATMEMAAPRALPRPPSGAEVLFRTEERPAVFALQPGGRVVFLPAEILSNARLGRPGHAAFLEGLARSIGSTWSFDEYHHGLVSATSEAARGGFAWDLFVLHLALLYALAVWAMARPLGPAWSDRAPSFGSTAAFFRSLGALHQRLGHHGEAARRLADRVAELEGTAVEPPSPGGGPIGPRELVTLARRLSSGRRAE